MAEGRIPKAAASSPCLGGHILPFLALLTSLDPRQTLPRRCSRAIDLGPHLVGHDSYFRLRLGRFDGGRFAERIRFLEGGLWRDRGAGVLAFSARLRATARLTNRASCAR